MARSPVNDSSFVRSLHHDVERMVENDHSAQDILASVRKRLEKQVRYRAYCEGLKIKRRTE